MFEQLANESSGHAIALVIRGLLMLIAWDSAAFNLISLARILERQLGRLLPAVLVYYLAILKSMDTVMQHTSEEVDSD